jgi:uncharacterized protein
MVRLTVHVHPRASKNAVVAHDDGTAEVWTTAPPVDGRANEAVCGLVADHLGLPRSYLRVVTGAGSRTKTLEIDSLNAEQLRERLATNTQR